MILGHVLNYFLSSFFFVVCIFFTVLTNSAKIFTGKNFIVYSIM